MESQLASVASVSQEAGRGGETASGSIRPTSHLHLQPRVISATITAAAPRISRWRLRFAADFRDTLTNTGGVIKIKSCILEHLVHFLLCVPFKVRICRECAIMRRAADMESRSDICTPQDVG